MAGSPQQSQAKPSGVPLDVVCIGTALVDHLAFGEASVLDELGFAKGSMNLVDVATSEAIRARVGEGRQVSGGTTANTAVGVASLGGRSCFLGAVADDADGERYAADLEAAGVEAGVPIRVAYPPGRGHLIAPALDAAAHALRFYAEYFDLPYPADKLDLVALPDFAAGAMENLGCVTFREAILLADPEHSSRSELERLAEVVDHELAHMWFGDLVTMRWWNGIWLNEAFATFMALCCEDDYRPDWQVFTSFARSKAAALGIDALHCTRPIEFPVHHAEDAAAMFDVLTYEKGASVLWMIEHFIGKERFRAGIRRYLRTYAYANTETSDLWDAIGAEAPDVPVREVMERWIFQGGYPLISATTTLDEEGAEAVRLAQEPFAYLPADVAALAGTLPEAGSAIGRDWLVPVLYEAVRDRTAGQRGEPKRILLDRDGARLPATRDGGALLVNADGAGFYRLAYDQALRTALLGELEQLDAIERFNLIGDTWATTLAGRGELADFFEVLRRLSSETDPHVWSIAIGALGLIDLVLPESERPGFAAFVRSLLVSHLQRTGWERVEGEDEQTPLLRAALVSALGTIGDDHTVIARAKEHFAADLSGERPIDPDLSAAVLGVVAAHASLEEFEATLERFRHPRDPMEGIRCLYSLARLRDHGLVERVLSLSLSEIRSQNAPILLGAMLSNREAGGLAFDFIQAQFPAMLERFPQNLIPRMLEGITGLAQLDESGEARDAARARRFCDEQVRGPRRRLVDQSLERLEVNVRFAKRVRTQLPPLLTP